MTLRRKILNSNIVQTWNNTRIVYQQRYVRFLKTYHKTQDIHTKGHLEECERVLHHIFGLTKQQIQELEIDYIGLTKEDLT